MIGTIIDGKQMSLNLQEKLSQQVQLLLQQDIRAGLAVILVGSDPASQVYVGAKERSCQNLGILSKRINLPEDAAQQTVIDTINKLNEDDSIHGILLQLPLPDHLDEALILSHILPQKDVDGFTSINAGLLSQGSPKAIVPCTPLGCKILLKETLGDLSGLNAVVVGRSNIVGKPMANLLLQENCTVTMAHSRTKDLQTLCASADILVAAVGRAEMITGDWVKKGATVIDVGINRVDDPSKEKGYRLTGDVHTESAIEKASFITPVPGGVGPMTIACLMLNTLICCRRFYGLANIEI